MTTPLNPNRPEDVQSPPTTLGDEPGAPSPLPGPRGSSALLVDRNFGPWFWGNAASNSGSWAFNVTAAVVVYRLSGSALLVGLLSVAQFAPLVVLSPWAGALSDRVTRRRRIVLAGQSVAATAATAIAVLALWSGVEGLPGAWPVLLAAFGIGVGKAFAGPSASSLVPSLVDDADLEGAVALTQLTYNLGRALGPVGAGVLLATLGPEAAFALNAVSFLAFIAALQFVRERARPSRAGGDRSVRAGLRHVRGDRVTLLLLCGAATAGFAADPVITLAAPLTAALGGADAVVAAMVSGFGVVATLAAFVSPRLQRAAGNLRTAGAGMALMAAGLVLAAAAPAPWVAVAGFAANGAGFACGITSFTTALQRRVPDALRGRIMALWVVAFLGNRPIAALLHGGAADLAGPRAAMAVAVTVALAGAGIAVHLHRAGGPPPPKPTRAKPPSASDALSGGQEQEKRRPGPSGAG